MEPVTGVAFEVAVLHQQPLMELTFAVALMHIPHMKCSVERTWVMLTAEFDLGGEVCMDGSWPKYYMDIH